MRAAARCGLSALCLSMSLGCKGAPEATVVKGTAVEHGEVLFHDRGVAKNSLNAYACATCHEASRGEAGEAILTGAPLAGALVRPSYWGGHELDLLSAINDCLSFFMLASRPWTADDDDARAVYAYLESLPGGGDADKAAPFTVVYALTDAPAGDAKRGEAVYGQACASCHGPAHTGARRLVDRASVLPEQALAEHPLGMYTAEERRKVFIEKIRHGGFVGYGGQMPPFSSERLAEKDIGDLLSFLGLP